MHVGRGEEHAATVATPRAVAVVLPVAEHATRDLGRRVSIEVRQHALNRIQQVIAGYPPSQRRADHPPEKLSDVGLVLGGTERHEHLGPRAVPAGGDRVLGEQHADVCAILHRLRADVRDREPTDLNRRVIAEDMRHRVRFQLRPSSPGWS